LERLSFVVADGSPGVARFIAAMLTELGAASEVRLAYSGSQAIDLLAAGPADCILADLHMPAGNGLQLLHSLRCGYVRTMRRDACLVLTASGMSPAAINAAKELDANGLLLKPFTQDRLAQEIARARRRVFPLIQERYARIDPIVLGTLGDPPRGA
jgi:CheY-like chemotaxis protein